MKGAELVVKQREDLTTSRGNVSGLEEANYWDREYIHECLNGITDPSHKMLFTFLWMTGLRITEAINVRKENLDFTTYLVCVRWQKREKKKSHWMRRYVPLHPVLKDLLQLYTAPMKAEDLVFPISRVRAWQLCQKYFKGGPHKLRHSFAVNWLRSGGEVTVLSRMLGHSNIRTTMVYLQIVPIDQGKELLKVVF
jgi:integrase/recombinase XerD